MWPPCWDTPFVSRGCRRKSLGARKTHIPFWNDVAVCARRAAQKRGPLLIATPDVTRLDESASTVYRAAPDDLARLGFASPTC